MFAHKPAADSACIAFLRLALDLGLVHDLAGQGSLALVARKPLSDVCISLAMLVIATHELIVRS